MRPRPPSALILIALLACSGTLAGADGADTAPIRLGYQRYGTLNILKISGALERKLQGTGITVTWSLFPAGPQLLEGLNVGSIDIGSTGEAPPVFAQAAGVPLVYVGTEPPNPDSEGLLVPKDSPITAVAQLKGRKIALNKGSNVHYFLVKLLEANGLAYGDVQVEYLKPADARSAFERGAVDAWAIWDPFYTAAKTDTGARVLADGTKLVANREFFLAHRDFATKHPHELRLVLDALAEADVWASHDPAAVGKALSPDVGLPAPVLEEIARRQSRGVFPVDAAIIADQQRIADVFLGLKLIPQAITVADIVPAPVEPAAGIGAGAVPPANADATSATSGANAR
jgi:sulfonate transport system substrate-binding protein